MSVSSSFAVQTQNEYCSPCHWGGLPQLSRNILEAWHLQPDFLSSSRESSVFVGVSSGFGIRRSGLVSCPCHMVDVCFWISHCTSQSIFLSSVKQVSWEHSLHPYLDKVLWGLKEIRDGKVCRLEASCHCYHPCSLLSPRRRYQLLSRRVWDGEILGVL